jgi:hypothetical protein
MDLRDLIDNLSAGLNNFWNASGKQSPHCIRSCSFDYILLYAFIHSRPKLI